MHNLISEGSSSAPQAHLCLRSNLRDVPASAPQFWSESVVLSGDTSRRSGHRAPENSGGSEHRRENYDSRGSADADGTCGAEAKSHVPRCLLPFVEPVASATKAVVLLREYDQASRASLLAADGGPAAVPTFSRHASFHCSSFRPVMSFVPMPSRGLSRAYCVTACTTTKV